MSNTNTEMSLSDEVIGQIARLVQIAILTGTDVVDNLRTLRVIVDTENEASLTLSEEYRAAAASQIETLMADLENMTAEETLEEEA